MQVHAQTTASAPVHDKPEQLQKIQHGLLQGENVLAVFDGKGGGTGFLGLTDRRIILQDNSFVGKKVALTSVPYSRVNAVSFVSDKSMFGSFASSSSLAISAGGKMYEVEFRGEDKAKYAHDVILFYMKQEIGATVDDQTWVPVGWDSSSPIISASKLEGVAEYVR